MVEVVVSDEFRSWYEKLTVGEQDTLYRVVGLLEAKGAALGYPHSSSLRGSSYPLRELRAQWQGRPYRVIYAFDPLRQAVLLIGGDKTGRMRFYQELIPRAESIWEQYLESLG